MSETARPESGPLIGGESGRLRFPLRGLFLEAQEEALVSSTACGAQPGRARGRAQGTAPTALLPPLEPLSSLSCKRNENPRSRSPSLPRPLLEKKKNNLTTATAPRWEITVKLKGARLSLCRGGCAGLGVGTGVEAEPLKLGAEHLCTLQWTNGLSFRQNQIPREGAQREKLGRH